MISRVALLAEGVDRNYLNGNYTASNSKSPSSRRAWIEISSPTPPIPAPPVALLAEGVDRNSNSYGGNSERVAVALLAEGVDRNSSRYIVV